MTDNLLFNKESEPIDMTEWARLMRDDAYRVIAYTQTDHAQVSTVWLGVNTSIFGGPPQIFETMIFGGKRNGEITRYATVAEARLGHAAICKEVFGE